MAKTDAAQSVPYETIGSITTSRPDLISPDAKIEKLGGDFRWSEGPVWVKKGGYVLFTDVPQNRIHKFKDGEGITTWMDPAGSPDPSIPGQSTQGGNGLIMWDDDHIIMPDHGSRALVRVNLDTQDKTVVADRFEGKRLNSPNDVTKHANGTLYFTDPPYGLDGREASPARELDFNGVFAVSPDGEMTLIEDGLKRPNGIILSPDQMTLYVANADPEDAKWLAYPLDKLGKVTGEGQVLLNVTADFATGKQGNADGMAVDMDGNIWATGPGGVIIFSPTGERLGLISTGSKIANVTFGGADGSMLYMTSHKFLARVKTNTKGVGF
ncbi:SMP-30/gluconolactonase/LRE family protein [Litorimonas sp. RW-G-Af-16]|uniref:SMP-30/gluconolactonase/LRE family protein n=1 Tax=Litorimonas sp. RW-G-Af-16 TaxID=3241168 RepID=UPI00390C600C